MFSKMFIDHPKSIGMSYAKHGAGAASIGLKMIGGGILCLIHALIPGLFERTTTNILEQLTETCHRRRAMQQEES